MRRAPHRLLPVLAILATLGAAVGPATAFPVGVPAAGTPMVGASPVPVPAPLPGSGPYTPHPPIVIVGDAMFTPANGVVAGSGTAADPYVIAGWVVDGRVWSPTVAGTNPFPPGIFLQDTSAHVVIQGNLVEDNPQAQVWIEGASNVTVKGNVLATHAGGPDPSPRQEMVRVEDASYVTVRDNLVSVGHHAAQVAGIVAGSTVAPRPHDVVIEGNRVELHTAPSGTTVGVGVNGARAVVRENHVVCDASATDLEGVGVHGNAVATARVDVTANQVDGCGRDAGGVGIRFGPGASGSLVGNVVANVTTGILVRGTGGTTVSGTRVTNAATALTLDRAGNVRATNLTASACDLGLQATGGWGIVLRGMALGCTRGVALEDAQDVVIENLTATSIRLNGGARVAVNGSTLDGAGGTGVEVLGNATGVSLENVSVTGHDVGVQVQNRTQVALAHVVLAGNTLGLRASDGANVTLHRSAVAGNDHGVLAEGAGTRLDATGVWWGNATGPSGDFSGSGDSARAILGAWLRVDPWLTTEPAWA